MLVARAWFFHFLTKVLIWIHVILLYKFPRIGFFTRTLTIATMYNKIKNFKNYYIRLEFEVWGSNIVITPTPFDRLTKKFLHIVRTFVRKDSLKIKYTMGVSPKNIIRDYKDRHTLAHSIVRKQKYDNPQLSYDAVR